MITTRAHVCAGVPTPLQLRFNGDVRPVRCGLDLFVLPDRSNFTGQATIELKLSRPVSTIWLHGRGLAIDQASIESHHTTLPARVETNEMQRLGFTLDHAIPQGRAVLRVAYRGSISDQYVGSGSLWDGNGGVFRREAKGEWYAATHLSPTYARRVFPCFDEPSFRIPWQITLHVRREHTAVSNMPMVSEVDEPGGMKCVRFGETEPLPSYVVAFAVGPFDAVSLGKLGRKGTPVRVLTPRGRTSDATFVCNSFPAWLRMLEDYFGVPFPYAKLDFLTVPGMPAPGMENAGLIICEDDCQLGPAGQETTDFKWFCSDVAVHEMAHEWFGDLVGLPWWDQDWFKESFAFFISRKVLHQWDPAGHELPTESVLENFGYHDHLSGTNTLNRTIATDTNILAHFGATFSEPQLIGVLNTFDAWVGEKVFQKSVKTFLRQHAGKTVTGPDFAKTLSAVSRQDLQWAFSTFTDQPGVPLVKVQIKAGETRKPILVLEQERLRGLGSRCAAGGLWGIPIRVRYAINGDAKQLSFLLKTSKAEVALKGTPEWLLVNEDAAGCYRTAYPVAMLDRLLSKGWGHLSTIERVGLVEDVRASVNSGALSLGEALRLLPPLLADPEPRVFGQATKILQSCGRLAPDNLVTNYQRFVRATMAPALSGVSWRAVPDEAPKARQRRLALLGLMANEGAEPALLEEARRLAAAWLADRNTLDAETAPVVLGVAGCYSDQTMLVQLLAEAKRTTNTTDRALLFGAIGNCRDDGLLRSVLLALAAKEYQPADASALIQAAYPRPRNRTLLYVFVKEHLQAVMAALPEEDRDWLLARMIRCSDERGDAERFLNGKEDMLPNGAISAAQVLDDIDFTCGFRSFHEESVRKFLSTQ